MHVIVDNNAIHETPSIQRWLLRQRRFTLHFTPTYSSSLNLVERWFAELTRKRIKRGTHRSVHELVASMRTWIKLWNEDPKAFVWHKAADEILEPASPLTTRRHPTRRPARRRPRVLTKTLSTNARCLYRIGTAI